MCHFERIKMVEHICPKHLDGGSCPHKLKGENGKNYALKFKENLQGSRVLINELIYWGIARIIHSPCPRGVIADIDENILKNICTCDRCKKYTSTLSIGPHFASEWFDAKYYLDEPPGTSITNIDDIPKMILSDVLTLNLEGYLRRHCLIDCKGNVTSIDHGFCFNDPNSKEATWTSDSLCDNRDAWPSSESHVLSSRISGLAKFFAVITATKELLTGGIIHSTLDQIPDQWWGNMKTSEVDGLKESLAKFIIYRRDNIETILLKDLHFAQ